MIHKPSLPGRGLRVILYGLLCVLSVLAALQMARSLVLVTLDMRSSVAGTLNVSWHDHASQYSEFNSKTTQVREGQHTYFLALWSLGEIDNIAIKPIDSPAQIAINSIVISSLGHERVVYDTNDQFVKFKPSSGLADISLTREQLIFRTLDQSAQFEFEVIHPQINDKNAPLIDLLDLRYALIVLAFLMTLGFAYPLAYLVLLVIGLISGYVYFSPFATHYAIIKVKLHSEKDNNLAVYWAGVNESYAEQYVRRIATSAGNHSYLLGMGELQAIKRIRVDPMTDIGKVLIDQIEIKAFGYEPIVLNADNKFEGVVFEKNNHLSMAGKSLVFSTDQSDTYFEINLDETAFKVKHTLALYGLFLAVLLLMALLFYLVKLKYPGFYQAIKVINIRVGTVIVGVMLVQLFFGAEHDFYMDILNVKVILLLTAIGLVAGFFYTSMQLYVLYWVFFLALFFNTQANLQLANFTITLKSPVSSYLSVFWASKFEPYQEHQAARIKTVAGTHRYQLALGHLNDIYSLRVDPLAAAGRVVIENIALSGIRYDPIHLNAANQFYAVDVKANPSLRNTLDGLVLEAKTPKEFFEVKLDAEIFKATYALKWYLGFVLVLALVNLASKRLKVIYPEASSHIGRISLKVGGIILAMMLLIFIFSADHGFFTDYQANQLVLTTSGELAQKVLGIMPDAAAVKHLAHFDVFNLTYGALVLLMLLGLGSFSTRANVFYFVAFLLLVAVIGIAIKNKNTLIHIEMDSSTASHLKVYWADEAELYQEQHSASVDTQIGQHTYTLAMANLNNIHQIRIEPLKVEGKAEISQISINELGFLPIVLNAKNYFYAADPILKTKTTNKETTERLGFERDKLIYAAVSNDRFFELILEPDAFKAGYPISFYLQLLVLLAVVWSCLYFANRYFGIFQCDAAIIILRFCWVIVAVMILQMSWMSSYDAHPDEKAHIDSIDYYTQNWTPPVVGDSRSLNTYQYPWGVSRLDALGVSYLFMGKLKNVLTQFAEDTVFTCRVFNCLLVAGLLWGTRNRRFALYLIPLLCLPQIWHLFSYTNRDGFALFLAVLLGWQLVNQDSHLYRFLNFKQWRYVVLPASLMGLLSIEILNYVIFILYFVAVLVWQGLFLKLPRRPFLVRCLILVLLAGSLFGVRKAVDVFQNGFNKQAQILSYAEAVAAPDFKPSVAVTDKGYFGLRLQQKGVAAMTLFEPRWEWQVLTFKSFAGLYGNEFAEYSPEWYYTCVAYLLGLVAMVLSTVGLIYGNLKMRVLVVLTAIFVFGDLLMGFLYSWTYDFQPQGRYIFPFIPMMMVTIFKMAPDYSDKVKAFLLGNALVLFVLGLFSFRFIALTYLVN